MHTSSNHPTLPIPPHFTSDDAYVSALLTFITTNTLHRTLCGGVHILDFFTQTPALYDTLLPSEWRSWFAQHDISTVLDLLLREDIEPLLSPTNNQTQWRNKPLPPASLLTYITSVRHLTLQREYTPPPTEPSPIPPHIAIGMKTKKVHEVSRFAAFLDRLAHRLAHDGSSPGIVDLGAGQNYLGRTLASPPYAHRVVAVEGREHNVEGARNKDVSAGLGAKSGVRRDKKAYRAKLAMDQCAKNGGAEERAVEAGKVTGEADVECMVEWLGKMPLLDEPTLSRRQSRQNDAGNGSAHSTHTNGDSTQMTNHDRNARHLSKSKVSIERTEAKEQPAFDRVQHVFKRLTDGDLTQVFEDLDSHTSSPSTSAAQTKVAYLVTTLHACGNLSHHALRSLIINTSVHAVAVVGCCYNMLSERLIAPDGEKVKGLLRPANGMSNGKLGQCERQSGDQHGFPMSSLVHDFVPPQDSTKRSTKGIAFNITARMMAVQAPANWSEHDSTGFFTRHFFRALLQRILVNRGGVDAPTPSRSATPLVIGSVRKANYDSFPAYVRGAVAKLASPSDPTSFAPGHAAAAARAVKSMEGISDDEISHYAKLYADYKHELSVVWSLMAFSAQLVEAVILVDRWAWLREQPGVVEARVEAVWEYSQSPRNMVVIGIKEPRVG